MVTQISEIVTEINSQGTPVLLVEQNAPRLCTTRRPCVRAEAGRIVPSADAASLFDDESVKAAYLDGT